MGGLRHIGILTLLACAAARAGQGEGHEALPAPLATTVVPTATATQAQAASLHPSALHRGLFIESIPRGSFEGFLNPGSTVRRVTSATCWGVAIEVVSDVDDVVKPGGPYCAMEFYLNLALAPRERARAGGTSTPAPTKSGERVLQSTMRGFPAGSAKAQPIEKGAKLRVHPSKDCWGVMVIVGSSQELCVSERELLRATGQGEQVFPAAKEKAKVSRDWNELRGGSRSSAIDYDALIGSHESGREREKATSPSGSSSRSESITVNLSQKPSGTTKPPSPATPAGVAAHTAPAAEDKPPVEKPEAPPFRSELFETFGMKHYSDPKSSDSKAKVRMAFPPEWLDGRPVTLGKHEANEATAARMDGSTAKLILPNDRCRAGILQFGDQFCMVLSLAQGQVPSDKMYKGYQRDGDACEFAAEAAFNGPLPIDPPPRYKLRRDGKRDDTEIWGTREVLAVDGVDLEGKRVPPPKGRWGDYRIHSGRESVGNIEDRKTKGCLRLAPACQDRFLAWVDRQKGKAVMDVDEVDFYTRDVMTSERALFSEILSEKVTGAIR